MSTDNTRPTGSPFGLNGEGPRLPGSPSSVGGHLGELVGKQERSDRFVPSHESIVAGGMKFDPLAKGSSESKERIPGVLPAPGRPSHGSRSHSGERPELLAIDGKTAAENNRRLPILVGVLCFIVGGLLLTFYFSPLRNGSERIFGDLSGKKEASLMVSQPVQISNIPAPVKVPPVKVYIVGAVKKPGVYSLPFDARVEDAVRAAGGMTDEADVLAINLARRIKDEDKITVYFKKRADDGTGAEDYGENGDQSSASAVSESERPTAPPESYMDSVDSGDNASAGAGGVSSASGAGGAGAVGAGAPMRETVGLPTGNRVNINTASVEQLQALKGIGPKLATEIYNYRLCLPDRRFTTPEQLGEVPGIGPTKLKEILPNVDV